MHTHSITTSPLPSPRPCAGAATFAAALLVLAAACNTDGRAGARDAGVPRDLAHPVCGYCDGNQWVPCNTQGKPDTPIDCDVGKKVCFEKLGCVSCRPGEAQCISSSTLGVCGDKGEFTGQTSPCDLPGGQLCSGDACVSACEAVSREPTNQGCEFWAVDLDNEYSSFNDAAGAPWGVVLSNAGAAPAKVVIEQNNALPGQPLQLSVVKTLTIAPGSLETVTLPTREVDGSKLGKDDGPGTWVSSNAFRITSTAPLVAYQFNPLAQMFSNDASLLIPTNGLGSAYRVLGWPTTNPISIGPSIPGIPDHSFVTVVGVKPGTKVTVTLGGAIVAGGTVPARPKGGKIEVTLGPFDVLNLESDGIPGDMTGTLVVSSQPVVVFSGGERGIAPITDGPPPPPDYDKSKLCCTDHLEEQLFPVTSLGRKFVVTRSPIRSTGGYVEPDIVRFVGAAATTTITTTMPPPFDKFTLKPGEMKDTWTTKDVIVEATEPVMVGQILVSQHFCNYPQWGGDPSLTIYPPVEQFRADYLFLVPKSWKANFVVVAAPVGSTVKIDNAVPSNCVVTAAGAVNGTPYESRRCPIGEGAHRMTGDAPFGVIAYGYGPVGSYAFAGGAAVKKIYEPPPIQ